MRIVSGNMDIAAFANEHQVTPLIGSLNPTTFARSLADIPQYHLLGKDDKIITKSIVDSYLLSLSKYDSQLSCVEIDYFSGVSHSKGWESIWQRYLNKKIACN